MSCPCNSVTIDLQRFHGTGRLFLCCSDCGKVWPYYLQWIHRLDPLPPSIPGAAVSSDSAAPISFLKSWWWIAPVVVFLIALAIAFRFVA